MPWPSHRVSRVIDDLEAAQLGDVRRQVRDLLLDMWDVRRSQVFVAPMWALTRMHTFERRFRKAWLERGVHFWVVPQAAAVAFEGVYEARFIFWLQEGPSETRECLAPAVEHFVAVQVGLFGRAIGA